MKKNFVIDTNVLLYDPYSLFKFQENCVIIPITVVKELNKFKGEPLSGHIMLQKGGRSDLAELAANIL
jgi:predicted ribonuclease YlaK